MRRSPRFLAASALVLTGCTGLIGVNDLFFDSTLAGGDEGGAPDGGKTETGSVTPEASPCGVDTNTSKQNCGRCGHDCLGGDCMGGQCQSTTILNAQGAPRDLTFDDKYVYVANYGDGTIQRVGKDGANMGTVLTGWSDLSGLASAEGKLFWVAQSSAPTGTAVPDGGTDNDSFGGVWTCSLPACTDKKLISKSNYPNKIVALGGYVYVTSQDDVRRVKYDGTGEQILDSTVSNSFGIAVDDTHVYYDSFANTLSRSALDGSANEGIGAVGYTSGLIAIDSQRVFWTFFDSEANGYKGTVYSTLKATPGNRVSYGDKNVASIAVASDEKNVYWLNDATYDGYVPNADGALLTCPVTGCVGDPTVMMSGLRGTSAIRIDGSVLYFLEYGGVQGKAGRLLKIATQ